MAVAGIPQGSGAMAGASAMIAGCSGTVAEGSAGVAGALGDDCRGGGNGRGVRGEGSSMPGEDRRRLGGDSMMPGDGMAGVKAKRGVSGWGVALRAMRGGCSARVLRAMWRSQHLRCRKLFSRRVGVAGRGACAGGRAAASGWGRRRGAGGRRGGGPGCLRRRGGCPWAIFLPMHAAMVCRGICSNMWRLPHSACRKDRARGGSTV